MEGCKDRYRDHVGNPEISNFRKGSSKATLFLLLYFLHGSIQFQNACAFLCSMNERHGYDLNGTKNNIWFQLTKDLTKNNFPRTWVLPVHGFNSNGHASICGGTPMDIQFTTGNSVIQSVKDNPHKFLGSRICFSGKTAKTYDFCQRWNLIKTPKYWQVIHSIRIYHCLFPSHVTFHTVFIDGSHS